LNGGAGDDQITGGAGADTIRASFGRDIVKDFTPGSDRLDVGFFQFLDFASVMAAATDVGGNVAISLYDDSTITLSGVHKAELQVWDIIL
jgi:Ca2+-binding RTX toxin-like protein